MITKEQILGIISEKIYSDEVFVVDLKVSASNKIQLQIDSISGIGIDYCVTVSKLIESSLDRESEDFELEVSSPGLGQPFKVAQQYLKNIGREIQVTPFDGKQFSGILKSFIDGNIIVECAEKVKVEGSKKRELVQVERKITQQEIKKAELIVKFK
jgi:ribosome maturation factor RimP